MRWHASVYCYDGGNNVNYDERKRIGLFEKGITLLLAAEV